MKKPRLIGLVLILTAILPQLSAQQLSLFTQYRENAVLLNPAAMESDFLTFGYNLSFGINYRRQWVGLENGPEIQSVRVNYINDNNRGATFHAGGFLLNDQTGPTGYTGVYGKIGTVLSQDPEEYGFSVGLSLGYVGFQVRASELTLQNQGDALGMSNQNQTHPDIGLGIYYYNNLNNDNLFYAGLSAPQILGFDVAYTNPEGEFDVTRLRHYFATAGYYLFTGNESFLEFSSWAKYVEGAPFNADLTVRYQLPSLPYVGMGISTAKVFHFEAGINYGQSYSADSNFRVGYAFDYSFSDYGPSAGGTHELQVSVSLDR